MSCNSDIPGSKVGKTKIYLFKKPPPCFVCDARETVNFGIKASEYSVIAHYSRLIS